MKKKQKKQNAAQQICHVLGFLVRVDRDLTQRIESLLNNSVYLSKRIERLEFSQKQLEKLNKLDEICEKLKILTSNAMYLNKIFGAIDPQYMTLENNDRKEMLNFIIKFANKYPNMRKNIIINNLYNQIAGAKKG